MMQKIVRYILHSICHKTYYVSESTGYLEYCVNMFVCTDLVFEKAASNWIAEASFWLSMWE